MNPWYRKKAEQQVDIQNQRASSQQGERKKERKKKHRAGRMGQDMCAYEIEALRQVGIGDDST